MRVVKEGSLSTVNGEIFYKGDRFDGVSLLIVGNVVIQQKLYKDGVYCSEYISPYICVDDTTLCIDSVSLDDEYEEPCSYNDSPFTGVAYFFEEDLCISQRKFQSGWLISEVNYRENGALDSIDIGNDDFSQKYEWFDDGSIKEFEIFERDFCRVWLKFSKENTITSLVIEGEYFSRLLQFKDKIIFDFFNTKSCVENYSCSEYLFLSGDGVDDEVFDGLLKTNVLSNTSKLRVYKSALSSVSIEKLKSSKKIQKLYVESEGIGLDCLKSFKSKQPDVYVEFDRKEVLV